MPTRKAGHLIALLATISALGSLATHMVVPALPALARDLATGPSPARQVIAFYLFGIAVGQLLAGPLADGIGRRPVLLGGLGLFTLASALGALSPSITVLLAARSVQALGAAAGLLTSRVIVGESFSKEEAARRQANLMSIVLLSPALAPVLGGLIAGTLGWRMIFVLLAVAGGTTLALCRSALPDTGSAGGRDGHATPSTSGALAQLAGRYRAILGNPRFLRLALALASGSCTLYLFLSVGPFLLIEHWGLGEVETGLCFLLIALGGVSGTFLVGPIERRTPPLRIGLAAVAGGTALLLLLTMIRADEMPWLLFVAPMVVVTVGAGIAGPSAMAAAMQIHAGHSATTISLLGAFQMLLSGVGPMLFTAVAAPGPEPLAVAMALVGAFAFAICPPSQAQ